MSYVAVEGW